MPKHFSASNLGLGAGPACVSVAAGSVSAAATAEAMSRCDVFMVKTSCVSVASKTRGGGGRVRAGRGGRAEGLPGAPGLGHAPGLSGAAGGAERRVAVEDLGDGA